MKYKSVNFNNEFCCKNVVIGGSGPSLEKIDYEKLPCDFYCIRVNNFFFEKFFFLGRKVDLVVFSGDKRALRFYVETLNQLINRNIYSIRGIASQNPYAKRFKFQLPFEQIKIKDNDLLRLVIDNQNIFQKEITSGIWAIIKAYELGAENIYLCGIDFYLGDKKYAYDIPKNFKKIILPNFNNHGYDSKLHSRELDMIIFDYIHKRTNVNFCNKLDLNNKYQLNIDPIKIKNDCLRPVKKLDSEIVKDWVSRKGFISIEMLVLFRKIWSWIKKIADFKLLRK